MHDLGGIMRFDMARHLGQLTRDGQRPKRLASLAAGGAGRESGSDVGGTEFPPPEFSWTDYLGFLIYIDAEIEHGLMVQYLYAGYSLGGPQVPEKYRDMIRGWQEVIFGIAKEEMGHLISVQNVLKLIGAPLDFGREDFPWDTEFYPFPFSLEPLTLQSLASYVYAESPVDWSGPDADEVKALIKTTSADPHHVAALFGKILGIIEDPVRIPDQIFQADTWPYQASWDQWGRGYQGGARGNTTGANPPATPNLLIKSVASRDDAVAALQSIAEQGELPPSASIDDPSHFARFLGIFEEMKALEPVYTAEGWTPARAIASNPYIGGQGEPPSASAGDGPKRDAITNAEAIAWAQLFNVRYRLLLTFLIHGYDLPAGSIDEGPADPLAILINATFGEMYNLRAIASILVQLPLTDGPGGKHAGPPFQLPYTLSRPSGEFNRWRQHREVLVAASSLIEQLLQEKPHGRNEYLISLREADRGLLRLIDTILEGRSVKAH